MKRSRSSWVMGLGQGNVGSEATALFGNEDVEPGLTFRRSAAIKEVRASEIGHPKGVSPPTEIEEGEGELARSLGLARANLRHLRTTRWAAGPLGARRPAP